MPKFQKYEGRNDSFKKHVERFIESMGPYVHDTDLCLKEFMKSPTHRVYTWYVNLKVSSVWDWAYFFS